MITLSDIKMMTSRDGRFIRRDHHVDDEHTVRRAPCSLLPALEETLFGPSLVTHPYISFGGPLAPRNASESIIRWSVKCVLNASTIATRAQGVCAVSLSSEPCLLALPCSATRGDLRIHDLGADGGDVVCEIAAHQQPIVRMFHGIVMSILLAHRAQERAGREQCGHEYPSDICHRRCVLSGLSVVQIDQSGLSWAEAGHAG